MIFLLAAKTEIENNRIEREGIYYLGGGGGGGGGEEVLNRTHRSPMDPPLFHCTFLRDITFQF